MSYAETLLAAAVAMGNRLPRSCLEAYFARAEAQNSLLLYTKYLMSARSFKKISFTQILWGDLFTSRVSDTMTRGEIEAFLDATK